MKQFYTNTINKLFVNKEYFTSIVNRHEFFMEKKSKKEKAVLKLAFSAVLAFSAIALVSGALLGSMAIAGLSVGYSCVAFLGLAFAFEIIDPFEKQNISNIEDDFRAAISNNPELLKDIYKLCVDKDASFKFNHLIDSIMHGKKDFAALEIFYKIMDNYELHQEISKSNPVRDLFMNQLKIKESEQSVPSTGKDKFLEML